MLFGLPDFQVAGRRGSPKMKLLANIKEAIQDYVATVDLLTSEKEVRVVEVAHA